MTLNDDISDADIARQLGLIAATSEFAAAPQLKSFLAYIVAKTRAGEASRIKAYTIATEALGRPHDFDPQEDAIVRVQARRLRQALSLHYAGPGKEDPIRIELPTGSYVPVITRQSATAATGPAVKPPAATGARRHWPLVALGLALAAGIGAVAGFGLLPLKPAPATKAELAFPALVVRAGIRANIPGWFDPELFTAALAEQLARFDELDVLAETPASPRPEASYALEITFSGSTYFVLGTARLVRTDTGKIVWHDRFDIAQDSVGLYGELVPVRRLASKLGQPYGIIYADVLNSTPSDSGIGCLLSGHEYFRQQTEALYRGAMACLQRLRADHPQDALSRVLLSYLMIEAYRDGKPVDDRAPLQTALALAREAVSLEPESARSHQALMAALAVSGDQAEALKTGEIAIALNPNDSDILADYGCRLVMGGEYARGQSYLKRAAELNLAPPAWHSFCLFVAANNAGDYRAAAHYAARLDRVPGVLASIAGIVVAGRRNDRASAEEAITALIAAAPLFASDPRLPMRKRGWAPAVIERLIADMRQAGYRGGD